MGSRPRTEGTTSHCTPIALSCSSMPCTTMQLQVTRSTHAKECMACLQVLPSMHGMPAQLCLQMHSAWHVCTAETLLPAERSVLRACTSRCRLPSRLYPWRVATKGISAKLAPNTLQPVPTPADACILTGRHVAASADRC
jgi:hypothetical protein